MVVVDNENPWLPGSEVAVDVVVPSPVSPRVGTVVAVLVLRPVVRLPAVLLVVGVDKLNNDGLVVAGAPKFKVGTAA